jgi:4-amino-4-deoxy-L-arabinose transferase-like glycosyltransferase
MQEIWQALNQNSRRQLVLLLLGGLGLRSAIALWLPPGFDEAYYYLYTRHLDWSYFDHPLMVALTTGFGIWLTGDVSQFTIRLGSLLLYTASLLLLYRTSAHLFSQKAGVLTVSIASLIPIFFLGFGTLTLPDSPLIFFWTATLYLATHEFFPSSPFLLPPSSLSYSPTPRLALLGLLVGLACLSKYHGLALGFGLLGFCLTSPLHRVALRSPWLVAGLGLFLLAIAPILVWNMQHDWVSLRFQSGRAVPDRGYNLLDLLVTFLAGVGYLFPSFGFPLWWVCLKKQGRGQRAEGRRTGEGEDRKTEGRNFKLRVSTSHLSPSTCLLPSPLPLSFLLWLSLPLMLGFTLMGGYRSILPTWAAPGFWSATLLLGQRAAIWQAQCPKLVRRWLWGSGLVIVTLLLVVLSHVTVGTLQQPGRYALLGGILPPSQDASVQLLDIQQLRRGFQTSPALRDALETTEFLFTNDLFLAGQVGMAVAPLTSNPVTCFSHDLRGFAFWSEFDRWPGQDGLLITTAGQAEAAIDQYRAYFDTIQKLADLPIQRGGTVIQMLQVYRSTKLLQPYPRPYGL